MYLYLHSLLFRCLKQFFLFTFTFTRSATKLRKQQCYIQFFGFSFFISRFENKNNCIDLEITLPKFCPILFSSKYDMYHFGIKKIRYLGKKRKCKIHVQKYKLFITCIYLVFHKADFPWQTWTLVISSFGEFTKVNLLQVA